MLKRRVLVGFLVLLMLALPVVGAASSAVKFEDGNLEAAVINEFAVLGRVVQESKIPQADMKLLKKLYAFGEFAQALGKPADDKEVIEDLTGLEFALKLEALDLSFNFIKDLSPIRNLSLSFLDITGNDDGDLLAAGTPAFSYNPSSPQMKILQEIQNRGAVVWHDGLVGRISGPDRYQTAIRIWQNMYTWGFIEDEDFEGEEENYIMKYTPGNTIVLARGDDFADALVGAPLAFALGTEIEIVEEEEVTVTVNQPAPILLTTPNKLHPATKAALVNYIEEFEDDLIEEGGGVFDVYVLGGTAAVSEAVVNELIYAIETEFDALDVRAIRIGGSDRYETSVAIAKKLADVRDDDGDYVKDEELVFASGEDFPDALAAAPYAAAGEVPILLTKSGALPACVVNYLQKLGKDNLEGEGNTFDAVVAGGSAAISESVIDQLVNLEYRLAGADEIVFETVTRVWGADRYATAVELGKHYGRILSGSTGKIGHMEDDTRVEGGSFFVATGDVFADALTGAPLAAMWNTGILLVKQDALPASVATVMNFQSNTTAGDPTANLDILGGEAAVSLYNAVKMYNYVRYPAWAPR